MKNEGQVRPAERMGWWTQKSRRWMETVLPDDMPWADLLIIGTEVKNRMG